MLRRQGRTDIRRCAGRGQQGDIEASGGAFLLAVGVDIRRSGEGEATHLRMAGPLDPVGGGRQATYGTQLVDAHLGFARQLVDALGAHEVAIDADRQALGQFIAGDGVAASATTRDFLHGASIPCCRVPARKPVGADKAPCGVEGGVWPPW